MSSWRMYVQSAEVGDGEFEDSGDFNLISRECYIYVFDVQEGSCPVFNHTIVWEFGPEHDYWGDIRNMRGLTWDGDNLVVLSEHHGQQGEDGDRGYPVFWVDFDGNLVSHRHIFWAHQDGMDYEPYLIKWVESHQVHWIANSSSTNDYPNIFVANKSFDFVDSFSLPPPSTSSHNTANDQGISLVSDGVMYGSYYDGTENTGGTEEFWERGIDIETREVVEEHNWGTWDDDADKYYLHGMAFVESQLYGIRSWEEDEIYLLESGFPFDFQQTCSGYLNDIPLDEQSDNDFFLFGAIVILPRGVEPPLRFQQRDDSEFVNNPNDPRIITGGQAPTTRQNSIRHSGQTYW